MESLPDDAVDHDPTQQQIPEKFPPNATNLVNPGRNAQNSIAEIEICIVGDLGHTSQNAGVLYCIA